MGLSSQIFLVSKRQAGRQKRGGGGREGGRAGGPSSPGCPQGGRCPLPEEGASSSDRPGSGVGEHNLLVFLSHRSSEGFQLIPGSRAQ